MNRNGAIAVGVAVVIGLVGVYLLNIVLSGVESRSEAEARAGRLTNIVVATQPIPYGGEITGLNTRIVGWPEISLPKGTFKSLDQLKNRVALQAIVPGEPLLASRVSGADGRATLSVNLQPGKFAVAVQINDISGVAGFVRPGDMVDVMLTRQIPGENARSDDKMTDVVMQAVRVLAIDQVADPGKTDPAVARSATLEVDQLGAQKLALARELGPLSLALRRIGAPPEGQPATVTPRDISPNGIGVRPIVAASAPQRTAAPRPAAPAVAPAPRPQGPVMTVYRKAKPTDYEVNDAF
ncbi:Flp pilus assembly protein CpaB [Novosphingobium taihuense]|uniref:Pilus assembly protein CpaB n=1 Tax=Novosphingobium taihuense TaxID=260085 RepID=A0A7W7AG74_9SPHN|nr:Flp pilus assembly protein CpaB [Novosphingobium taihuense]MBB4615660.1 pilus assembly protein CpaB [Novosphingobium taihuense]TWH79592.1 pilus assembly protein CpaB [Novosphingobium taihuense]